jgi:hypothetical protein
VAELPLRPLLPSPEQSLPAGEYQMLLNVQQLKAILFFKEAL